MTRAQQRRRGGILLGGTLIGGMIVAMLGAGPASAIPPSGAGPDTPGSSSSVWPTSIEPCGTLNYQVSGYPAGDTLYMKIDDGIGYGDTSVQGSGVWATMAINSAGQASGSFELPCDIAPGAHWIRMLASAYVDPQNPGAGVWGFTRRGGNDFTVVASSGGSGSAGSSGGGSSSGGNSGNSSANGGSQAAPGAGQVTGNGADQAAGNGGTLSLGSEMVPPSTVPAAPAASGETLPAAFGDKISVAMSGNDAVVTVSPDLVGKWVYVYTYSEPLGVGWFRVADDGTITVSTAGLEDGQHRIAVINDQGVLLGWTGLPVGDQAVAAVANGSVTSTGATTQQGTSIPLVGMIAGGVALLAAIIVLVWYLASRRKKPAAEAAADEVTLVDDDAPLDASAPIAAAEDASDRPAEHATV